MHKQSTASSREKENNTKWGVRSSAAAQICSGAAAASKGWSEFARFHKPQTLMLKLNPCLVLLSDWLIHDTWESTKTYMEWTVCQLAVLTDTCKVPSLSKWDKSRCSLQTCHRANLVMMRSWFVNCILVKTRVWRVCGPKLLHTLVR